MAEAYSEQMVNAARGWIGTPFRHTYSVKAVGCDCLGLVRGVFKEVTGQVFTQPPPYGPSWNEAGDFDTLLDLLGRHFTPVADQRPGDVVAFRMARGAVTKHCGIIATSTTFVHTYGGTPGVSEVTLVPWWQRRIVARFRLNG